MGGAAALDQRTYNIGDDDGDNTDPDSCTFDGADTPRAGQPKELNFMVRIGVAEDAGNDSGSKNWQLFGHTSDVPASATWIDTGTTTAWASISTGSIGDHELCATELCTPQAEAFLGIGEGIDASDETGKIELLASSNLEHQFCVQFTAAAGDDTTYYFYVRFNEAVLPGSHVAAQVTTAAGAGETLTIDVSDSLTTEQALD